MAFSYLFIFFALVASGVWFWRRRSLRAAQRLVMPSYVLLYDKQTTTLYKAERSQNGSFLVSGAEYPPALARRVDMSWDGAFNLYVIGIEAQALVQHRELESVRFGILTGNIFKPSGDMVETIRLVGAAAVVGLSIFVYLNMSSLNASLASQAVKIEQIQETLKAPLLTRPGPVPTPSK